MRAIVIRGLIPKWSTAIRCFILFATILLGVASCDPITELRKLVHRARTKARSASDAMTPVMKDPDRHQHFLDRIKEGDIGLLFLGDSITESWPTESAATWRQFGNYKPANFGVGADRIEHLLWRITHGELAGIDPKVVVVLIGTNNIGHFEDERSEWIANGIKQVVTTVHERLPRTKVLLLGIFPRDALDARQRKVTREVNDQIRKLDNGKDTRFLDIGDSFLDGNGNIRPEIMPDQLHLTAKGYEIWFEKMRPLLDEMMR